MLRALYWDMDFPINFKAVGIDAHGSRCPVQVSGNVRRGAGTPSGREEAAAASGVLKALGKDARQDQITEHSILYPLYV